MVVIPGLRLPDMPSMAEFYVVDPRSLSYAISEGMARTWRSKCLCTCTEITLASKTTPVKTPLKQEQ